MGTLGICGLLPPPDTGICFPWKLNRTELGASEIPKLAEKITKLFGIFLHEFQRVFGVHS
jgi:hypothetical protein